MNNCGIYVIQNVVTGDCYFGQSVRLISRLSKHVHKLSDNKHGSNYLQNAVNKYGIHNFIFAVLIYCEEFELTRYEQLCVDLFQSTYNVCKECVDSRKGIGHTVEARKKMSISHTGMPNNQLGRKHTAEAKRKMSLARTRDNLSEETRCRMSMAHRGKKLSKEHIQKLIASHKGVQRSEEIRHKISVKQLGKTISAESRHRMSIAQRKRFHSEQEFGPL